MTRFEKKHSPAIYTAIIVTTAAVFAADRFAPLGVAIFIGYMVPVALSFFTWRAWIPFVCAAVATLGIAIDGYLTPEGAFTSLAHLNRFFGVITAWMLAGIGHIYIKTRLAVVRQEWLQVGEAKLSEKLLGEVKMEQLGENLLRFLGDYLDAQAGAFFIEDGRYERIATFAAPPGSVPDHFIPGEGLLGQCVKDRKVFVIRDVPDGYLSIGSGLGQHHPRHLLIAPMMLDSHVSGVIELGFFNPIHESDTELLTRVSDAVAIAIRSAKYRRRLQELLEETQQQGEEIQAQNEELRVSNEELEEQSRAIRESQARLELQQVEMEQTNAQLEEQAQILEAQKDELTQSKSALEAQARVVEQASRYKSHFLANMSHELRTPLNSSLILAKLLADNKHGNLNAEQVRYAQTIQSSGNDLLALINDVLDLSKIEAGHMDIRFAPLRISQLISNLRAVFEPIASDRKLSFLIEPADDIPDIITTDSQRIEQILKNLISNALKFTEKGSVMLRITRLAGKRLSFSVEDTGIGISHDQQKAVFEPFCQADGTTSRKYGGTGLGLSISRELARLLGGSISLHSEPDQGSTFQLQLPIDAPESLPAQAEPAVVQEPEPPAIARPRRPHKAPGNTSVLIHDDRDVATRASRMILAVEDDPAFANILVDMARESGLQCLVALSAEEALKLAAQYLPSAVILDIGLPDNSGLSVLESLKRDIRTRHIPVHVVSASDYTQKALSLGAVGYSMKPVKHEELVQALQNLETRLTQSMRRVLVVEDDAVQMDAIKQLLGSEQVEAIGVQTAAECLAKLKDTTFDCMVLDLTLPDASGFSLLETLAAEDAFSFPPVIVYTGRDLSAAEEQRLRRYSDSIIIKGAKSPERLLDEVTLFLHQVVSELPPEKQKMLAVVHNRDTTLEGKHILIAEDDVRNIFALTSLLEGHGVKLLIARNGREALEALQRSLQQGQTPIDLVLMDIMMPEMDGLTAMREIRKRTELARLPIIALTAKAMKNDHEQCLAAGASDYLSKPLEVEKLLSLIRVWMRR